MFLAINITLSAVGEMSDLSPEGDICVAHHSYATQYLCIDSEGRLGWEAGM